MDLDMNDPEQWFEEVKLSTKRLTYFAWMCWAVAAVYFSWLMVAA